MPKINVYVPDDLGDALKAADLPVSAICQRALEQALRRITSIRQAVVDRVDESAFAERTPHLTDRARTVIRLAVERGRDAGTPVGTADVLAGLLGEGGNLALAVLDAMEIGREQVSRELDRSAAVEPAANGGSGTATLAAGGSPAAVKPSSGERHFSAATANALESAVSEAIGLGHNYVGCEHLLLGLVSESDGAAGKVLRSLGADPRTTRRAVTAALAGIVQRTRAQRAVAGGADPSTALAAAVRREVQPLLERIERLERLTAAGDAGDNG